MRSGGRCLPECEWGVECESTGEGCRNQGLIPPVLSRSFLLPVCMFCKEQVVRGPRRQALAQVPSGHCDSPKKSEKACPKRIPQHRFVSPLSIFLHSSTSSSNSTSSPQHELSSQNSLQSGPDPNSPLYLTCQSCQGIKRI